MADKNIQIPNQNTLVQIINDACSVIEQVTTAIDNESKAVKKKLKGNKLEKELKNITDDLNTIIKFTTEFNKQKILPFNKLTAKIILNNTKMITQLVADINEHIEKNVKGLNKDTVDNFKHIAELVKNIDTLSTTIAGMQQHTVALWKSSKAMALTIKSIKDIITVIINEVSSWDAKKFKESIVVIKMAIDLIEYFKRLIDSIKSVKLITLLLAVIKIQILATVIVEFAVFMMIVGALGNIIKPFFIGILAFQQALQMTADVVNILDKEFGLRKIISLRLRLPLIRGVINRIINLTWNLIELGIVGVILKPFSLGILLLLGTYKVLAMLFKLLDDGFPLKMLILVQLKLPFIRRSITPIIRLTRRLRTLGMVGMTAAAALPGMIIVMLMFMMYNKITHAIKGTKSGILFNLKLKFIKNGIPMVKSILRRIIRMTRIRGAKKALVNMVMLMLLVQSFGQMILALMAVSALLIIFTVIAPVVVIALIAFGLVMKILALVINKTLSAKTVASMIKFTICIGLLVLIGLGLLALALLSSMIVDNALYILGFFGIVIVVTLLLGILGYALVALGPVLGYALAGFAMVALMVFAVLAIAAMLWLIGELKLDADKIKNNVKIIIGCVFAIFEALFEGDLDDPEEKDGWFTKVIKLLGGAALKFIMALSACYVLVLTVVVVMCIFLIAAMLRLVQELKLDPGQILHNVDVIFDTVDAIIERVFAPRKDRDGKSNRGILLRIVSWISEGLAKVIEAALAVASLFYTLIAVGLVLAIAGLLRLLQIIELNPTKIMENVDMIFDTCDAIIERVFAPRKDKSEKSNRGILITIISWVDEGLAKIVEAAIGIVYLYMMLVCVGLVLAIAGLLRLLQELDLNWDTISENVKGVFDTADMIIERIMSPRSEEGEGSSRGVLLTIMGWVYGEGLVKIFEAALSIVYLFLIMICCGLVLGIAKLLFDIQNIDLKLEEITNKVDAIFDTANHIISRVFENKSDESKSGGSWLGKIIGFFNPGLGNIIDALMTIVNLALIFMTIAIVCGIAKELDIIQSLKFEGDALKKKVDDMFDTCNYIIDKVVNGEFKLPKKQKSDLSKLLSFFNPIPEEISDLMSSLSRIQMIITAIGAVGDMAKRIQTIYEACKDIDVASAGAMVTSIMGIGEDIAERVFGTESKFKFLEPTAEQKKISDPLTDFFFGSAIRRKAQQEAEIAAIKSAMKKLQALSMINSALGALSQMTESIKTIHDIDITDFSTAKTKVIEILDIATEVSNTIFGAESKIKLPEPNNDQVMAVLAKMGVNSVWRSAGEIAEAKMQAAMEEAMRRVQVLQMVATSIGTLASMIDGLKSINEAKIPPVSTVQEKVRSIMQAGNKIAFMIFNDDNTGIVGGNAAGIKGQVDLIKAKVDFAACAFEGILKIAAGLKNVADAQTGDLQKVKAKALSIIQTGNGISFMIHNDENTGFIGGNDKGFSSMMSLIQSKVDFACKGIDQVKRVVTSLSQLNDSMNNFQGNVDNTKVQAKKFIDVTGEIIAAFDSATSSYSFSKVDDGCKMIDRINDSIKKFTHVDDKDVRNSKAITENYIKFFKQVDSMDVQKLQHTDYIMRSWASVSRDLRGNFEGLAKTINEQIMPMLETLNMTMHDVNECQQEIIKDLTEPIEFENNSTSSSFTPSSGSGSGISGGATGESGPGAMGQGFASAPTISTTSETGKTKKPRPVAGNVEIEDGKRYYVILKDPQPA